MFKKLAIGTMIAVAAVTVLSYTKLGSYAGTAWNKARVSAKKQVPIEFEIDRLKNEVAQLIPDMKKNRSIIAEEMVGIDNLREEIASTRTKLDQQKIVLLKLSKDVEGGETTFVINGSSYPRQRIIEKLSRDLESFKRCEAELKSREQLLDAKERSLEAAKQQLVSMRDQKQELEVAIAQLEADLKTVRLAQTKCKFQVDDSRLTDIKRSLAELRGRLKVEKTAAELEAEFGNDPIPTQSTVKPANEVARDVREYLDGPKVADKK
ncbi:MAG: hypothetical protein K2R98_00270 [Gemmataceae bacterium]|nr:hypothetical protein [Gemmataceae bacterium]